LTNPGTADVVIIGGGLAGLCSAIHLSGQGVSVILIEKNEYPRHKVCGEYISNETLPYLEKLGIDPFELGAVRIEEMDFGAPDGESIRTSLPLGGFGISRYTLDHSLMKKAVANGTTVIKAQVDQVRFDREKFSVMTRDGGSYEALFVIGAHGKRSLLDRRLDREFMKKKSSYVAVKAHFNGEFQEDRVGLYNFEGGYCGVSNVENGKLNICYIADSRIFKKFKSIELFQKEVVYKNKQLMKIFTDTEIVFEKPLSISQISFDKKELVVDHVLMCGDSAGLIHPLCGNGMGMAIGAARLVSEAILSYFNGHLNSREEVAQQYVQSWNQNFKTRLRVGHALAALLKYYKVTFLLMPLLRSFPSVLRRVIRLTHGKPSRAI
jgi:flavin-dependent dehydrogenase